MRTSATEDALMDMVEVDHFAQDKTVANDTLRLGRCDPKSPFVPRRFSANALTVADSISALRPGAASPGPCLSLVPRTANYAAFQTPMSISLALLSLLLLTCFRDELASAASLLAHPRAYADPYPHPQARCQPTPHLWGTLPTPQ
jgi:hypothetical protein